MDAVFNAVKPILEALLGNYGWAVQVVAIIGVARLIFKPIMTAVQAIVTATPTPKDDEVLGKIMAHPAYTWFVFALDYLASLKLPKKE